MFRSFLATILCLTGLAASAESATEHCRDEISSTEGYLSGFGTIEISGQPLDIGGWIVKHSIMTVTFPDQEQVVLTATNIGPAALGDHITTTLNYWNKGHDTFVARTRNDRGHLFVLVQPFEVNQAPNCFQRN